MEKKGNKISGYPHINKVINDEKGIMLVFPDFFNVIPRKQSPTCGYVDKSGIRREKTVIVPLCPQPCGFLLDKAVESWFEPILKIFSILAGDFGAKLASKADPWYD